jgi:hypothetical protein
MNSLLQNVGDYFDKFFNAKNVRKIELLILRVAVFAFLFHLGLIFLGNNFNYFKNLQHSYLKSYLYPI